MDNIRWEGVGKTLRAIKDEQKRIKGGTVKGLFKAGMILYTESAEEVPVMTGNLRATEYIEARVIPEPQVEVGYTAVYAAAVHENPRSGKTGGISPSGKKYYAGKTTSGRKSTAVTHASSGKWKFLEDPFKRLQFRLKQIVKKEVRLYKRKQMPKSFRMGDIK